MDHVGKWFTKLFGHKPGTSFCKGVRYSHIALGRCQPFKGKAQEAEISPMYRYPENSRGVYRMRWKLGWGGEADKVGVWAAGRVTQRIRHSLCMWYTPRFFP